MKRIVLLLTLMWSQLFAAVFSQEDVAILKKHFLANIHTNGAIVASPSREHPNYYYDWVRDSALAMGLIETWYEAQPNHEYKNLMLNYVSWTEMIQQQDDPLPGQDIIGEPKFYLDGYPFSGSWGRPQNDGPALRALVLIRFAQQLLDQKEQAYVLTHLYNGGMDSQTMGVIKIDLEYTAHHWQDANFDLWEEVLGHHFFTAMAQKNSLLAGAALAQRLHDEQAAQFYTAQAQLINARLQLHRDPINRVIQATLPPHNGPQKKLELDSSIILAVLLNPQSDDSFMLDDELIRNTIATLHQQFNAMFSINENRPGAILFGRYYGDTYDGYTTEGIGNPWFILTATMAEYYFTLAHDIAFTPSSRNRALLNEYLATGDAYLELIKHYGGSLRLSEQINLNTGIQQGAESLTWNYVSILRAIALREKIANRLHH